jgi:hypothetical protein
LSALILLERLGRRVSEKDAHGIVRVILALEH